MLEKKLSRRPFETLAHGYGLVPQGERLEQSWIGAV